MKKFLMLIMWLTLCSSSSAQQAEPLGIALEGYSYPFEVLYHKVTIERKELNMAYMDIKPESTPKGVVVLFHGKNFFGAYWKNTISFLRKKGYRIIVPDQIGFGKSSKPAIAYSFHLLSQTTKSLLDAIEVKEINLVGHSMGGMLAVRYALEFPDTVNKLILENPIGLEDYRVKVPFKTVDEWYEAQLTLTREQILNYQKTYYAKWNAAYEEYVNVHHRWMLSPEYPNLAKVSALTFNMIYNQPILYELTNLEMETLLIIGQEDRTTLGRGSVSEEVLSTLGQYPILGKEADFAIPSSKLVELNDVGHIPHLETPIIFNNQVYEFIKN